MNPNAVRPDRDFTGKQKQILTDMKINRVENKKFPIRRITSLKQEGEDWLKKLPVEMRTMLMNLLNIETKVKCR